MDHRQNDAARASTTDCQRLERAPRRIAVKVALATAVEKEINNQYEGGALQCRVGKVDVSRSRCSLARLQAGQSPTSRGLRTSSPTSCSSWVMTSASCSQASTMKD